MKKIIFYSACMVNDKKMKVKRQGYYIKTEENEFGIFKNEYDFINKLDDSGYLDGNFYEQEPETHNARDAFDVYQIGDIINLLDAVQLETLDAERAGW